MVRLLALAAALSVAPAPAQLPKGTLWRDPAHIAAQVSTPKPPFTFVREDLSGTQPKVFVTDAAGAMWNVKFGYEVRPESFCWRIIRACGYFAEPNFFVPAGRFEGFQQTKRHDPTLHPDGQFTDARFQYRDPNLIFLKDRNWRWDRPPWAGARELSGLKILIMLFSNYDNKDARVGPAGGPNTAIFELRRPGGIEHEYAFTDWGSGMGRIGGVSQRTNWDCAAFAEESRSFVQRIEKSQVIFGYNGNINEGFRTGIPPSHVVWLMQYLGKVTDDQLRAALRASGANDSDTACFTKALRLRIEELRAVR